MTITKELLAEIKAKAEKAVQHRSAYAGPYWSIEIAPHTFTPYRLDLDPPTTIAFVEALEDAQRERDAAVQYGVRELMPERDALRAENEKLRAALTVAKTELFEAMDKFYVLGVNHPGGSLCATRVSMTAQHLDEDKAFMAKLADRMQAAAHAADAALKETTHATDAPKS